MPLSALQQTLSLPQYASQDRAEAQDHQAILSAISPLPVALPFMSLDYFLYRTGILSSIYPSLVHPYH